MMEERYNDAISVGQFQPFGGAISKRTKQSRCMGICSRFVKVTFRRGKSPYKMGYKKCNTCDYYTLNTDLRCKCCSYKFRTKPVAKKHAWI